MCVVKGRFNLCPCRFAFLRGCGCVLSERALKEVPSETCHKVKLSSLLCINLSQLFHPVYYNFHQCGTLFKSEDVTIINGTEEDVKRQREAMEERRLQAKQAKMAKVGLCI